MHLKDILNYEGDSGKFFILKNNKKSKQVIPDEDGYLNFYFEKKKYKLKANKVAIELAHNQKLNQDEVVLHRNMDSLDFRLINLKVISRELNKQIKEAYRNLSGLLKMSAHPTDAYSQIIQWRDEGKNHRLIVHDIGVAQRTLAKLQLKFAKILNSHCVFDL